MEVIIFLVVLVVLILVHEVGHFIVAKLSRMRVDEFGIGFPPRALTFARANGTAYTLNWLPFGGFVRIYGEDGEQSEPGSFASKPRILQAAVLLAGIVMNLIFAYLILTTTLVIGTQQALTEQQIASSTDAAIVIADIAPNSPAAHAAFQRGDEVLAATTTLVSNTGNQKLHVVYQGGDPLRLAQLISLDSSGLPMQFSIKRNGKVFQTEATPKAGVIPNEPSQISLGVTLASIGTVKTPVAQAPVEGLTYTWQIIKETVIGLGQFLKGVITFNPDLTQVAGPVGIANAVGQATAQGISALLTLTAVISINLAIVNLIPVPALDGGRLLFVIIEAVTRKPINQKIAERINMVGFVLLIILMLVVTAHDIFNLFH